MIYKYFIRYKDGTIVGRFSTLPEALMGMDLYEEIDKDAGIYEPDSYEIVKPVGSNYKTI